jgi:hypothetical protein
MAVNTNDHYWEDFAWVKQISGLEADGVQPYLLTQDVSVTLPVAFSSLLLYKLSPQQAMIMTRFEGFQYNPSALFPVENTFNNTTVFEWAMGDAGGNLDPAGKVIYGGLANAIVNKNLVAIFPGSVQTARTNIVLGFSDIAGPRNVNFVVSAYMWLIPIDKAAAFQKYVTQVGGG